MLHRPLLALAADTGWEALTLKVLLLHEDSTASPVIGDQFVSSLDPATNEVDHADYERQEATVAVSTWSTDHWTLDAGDVNFGALASEHSGQGVSLVALYAEVGDGTDDAANLLLKTFAVSPVEEFDGGDVVVAWHADGIAVVEQA